MLASQPLFACVCMVHAVGPGAVGAAVYVPLIRRRCPSEVPPASSHAISAPFNIFAAVYGGVPADWNLHYNSMHCMPTPFMRRSTRARLPRWCSLSARRDPTTCFFATRLRTSPVRPVHRLFLHDCARECRHMLCVVSVIGRPCSFTRLAFKRLSDL